MSLLSKLTGKSEKQIVKEKVRKETDKKAARTMTAAECYAELGICKERLERVIAVERLNALERREKRLHDSVQKNRIHDAAVGLLAVEEAEMAIKSTPAADDMREAQKKLSFVVRQLGKLDPQNGLTKKEVKGEMGADFEDSTDTQAFVERAELVDEEFVERLIQGFTLEECLTKNGPASYSTLTPAPSVDFSSGDDAQDAAYIQDILSKNANKR